MARRRFRERVEPVLEFRADMDSLPAREMFQDERVDLHRVFSLLPVRGQIILLHRFGLDGKEQTLKWVADLLNLTRERVRQLQENYLDKLRSLLHVPNFVPRVKPVWSRRRKQAELKLRKKKERQQAVMDEQFRLRSQAARHLADAEAKRFAILQRREYERQQEYERKEYERQAKIQREALAVARELGKRAAVSRWQQLEQEAKEQWEKVEAYKKKAQRLGARKSRPHPLNGRR